MLQLWRQTRVSLSPSPCDTGVVSPAREFDCFLRLMPWGRGANYLVDGRSHRDAPPPLLGQAQTTAISGQRSGSLIRSLPVDCGGFAKETRVANCALSIHRERVGVSFFAPSSVARGLVGNRRFVGDGLGCVEKQRYGLAWD